jgi:hypothetical protein
MEASPHVPRCLGYLGRVSRHRPDAAFSFDAPTQEISKPMNPSGSKLVVALVSLAVALGVFSWWHRYESAHRTTQFWGPEAAELILEPGPVEALTLQPAAEGELPPTDLPLLLDGEYTVAASLDLTKARGTVHLRHALTSDSNYVWDQATTTPDTWRWALRFHDADRQLLVLFTADLETLGKSADGTKLETISCQPMAETLQSYFEAIGLVK